MRSPRPAITKSRSRGTRGGRVVGVCTANASTSRSSVMPAFAARRRAGDVSPWLPHQLRHRDRGDHRDREVEAADIVGPRDARPQRGRVAAEAHAHRADRATRRARARTSRARADRRSRDRSLRSCAADSATETARRSARCRCPARGCRGTAAGTRRRRSRGAASTARRNVRALDPVIAAAPAVDHARSSAGRDRSSTSARARSGSRSTARYGSRASGMERLVVRRERRGRRPACRAGLALRRQLDMRAGGVREERARMAEGALAVRARRPRSAAPAHRSDRAWRPRRHPALHEPHDAAIDRGTGAGENIGTHVLTVPQFVSCGI